MPFGGPASGRRSVSPFVSKVLYHKPQESANDAARLSMMPTTTTRDQILEMAEDEDYSSLASNQRISQLMQAAEDISQRTSLLSLKRGGEEDHSFYQHIDFVDDSFATGLELDHAKQHK